MAREVTAGEIPRLFELARTGVDEFSGFLSDISGAVDDVIAHSVPEARSGRCHHALAGRGLLYAPAGGCLERAARRP